VKVEYIDPFIEASRNVIAETLGTEPTIGKPYIKTAPYASESVVTFIGITGEIRGNAVFSFHREAVLRIASTMMGGMSVQELDEMTKSAIAELCNMILGNAATLLSRKRIHVEITPPTVLTGDNLQFSPAKGEVVCIPIHTGDGISLELDIAYTEN